MTDIIKFATNNNINIEIKPQDGSFRPLVGKVTCIVLLKRGDLTASVTITETDTDATTELALHDALRKILYKEHKETA